MQVHTLTGILLAGGRSSRFGSPKAFATLKCQAMYRYPLQVLQGMTEEVVISSAPDLTKEFEARESVKVIEDVPAFKGKGPMAGIYSCMAAVKSHGYMVLPCDMPLISADILLSMVKECKDHIDIIVLNAYGRTQPLVAIYNTRVKMSLEAFLKAGNFRMMECFVKHEVLYLDESVIKIDENFLRNINRERDLSYIEQKLLENDNIVKR